MAREGELSPEETICSILREQFVEKVGTQSLGPTTRLRDGLSMDSLDLLALAAAVENVYGRPVLDEDTSPAVFATIGSFAAHLAALPTSPAEGAARG